MNKETMAYLKGFKDGMRGEILEELKPIVVQFTEVVSNTFKNVPNKLIDVIDIKVDASRFNDWIPCSERLPDNIGAVLITWANRKPEPYNQGIKDKPFTGVAHYCNGKWWWYSVTCEDYLAEYGRSDVDEMDDFIEVLAWMPMPNSYEPPEKGDET